MSFTNEDLLKLATAHTLPVLRYGFPDGWMSAYDLGILYNISRIANGPLLEVGPWLGRSTSAICLGVRDAGRPNRPFDVIDFGITSAEEWEQLLKVPFDPKMGDGVVVNAIYHPGGSNAVLVNNLKRNQILQHTTTITRGNFLDLPLARKYGFIFCDTVHGDKEAALYLGKLAELTAPRSYLVFDDVVDEEFANLLCKQFKVRRRLMTSKVSEYCKLLVVETE